MKAPLGFFDSNASGLIRGRLDAAAADTETLLAHNLADIVGTIVLFLSMLVLLFLFDWRMGAACFLSAVISVIAMFSMMGGKNAKLMAEYQAAQDRMTKAGTEYVRGIPVVKIFQQTVYSFKAFQEAIEDYSNKAEHYQADVCRIFSHHFYCACKNNVCFLRHYAGQYRFGTYQSGDGGTYPESTQSPADPS